MMKLLKQTLLGLVTLLFLNTLTATLDAQVTIGSGIAPTRAALLDLKEKQTANPATVGDTESAISGGLLLPRVNLLSTNTLQPFVDLTDADWTDPAKQKKLRLRLVGLMVYNVNTVGSSLYPGLYTWDGLQWSTSQANPSKMDVSEEPKAFSFYETGTETVIPLEFVISGAADPVAYQWYQITGNNVHVRVGTAIGGAGTVTGTGATTASFTPTGVIKGTTRNAKYTGFYKFYCIATDAYGVKKESAIAEVAVGCGAKNNAGEWMSFMCFNLGADNDITIKKQKEYNIPTYVNDGNGRHTYIPGEELIWGDLFQWGRTTDGHEKRNAEVKKISTTLLTDISNGFYCARSLGGSYTGDTYPLSQIKNGSDWYGKFITTDENFNYNWIPLNNNQATLDQLWKVGRFVANDPCAKYQADGTYIPIWTTSDVPIGSTVSSDPACKDSGTGWRLPQQEEWGAIYKGGSISGIPSVSSANTWVWYKGDLSPNINSLGYEIRPDGATTTLFLPASGNKGPLNGIMYSTGTNGYYWSSTPNSISAYALHINTSTVNPARSLERALGHSIRCVKH